MYHGRFKNSHYEAGYRYGDLLYKHGKAIRENDTFIVTRERKEFADACLPVYKKYYPEVLDEIKGLADGQRSPHEDFYTFLLSMYCFEFSNRCTCFAFKDDEHIVFARNSDFLVKLEKLYMNCLYALDGTYAFNGNTTAFIEMEDGINEYGLAAGLTFVYPVIKNAGLNSGILVRYILEKCKTTEEAIACIRALPIASQQTISVIDNTGAMAVIECNCRRIEIIRPTAGDNFIAATNGFHSGKMKLYEKHGIDDWRSDERYEVARTALKENRRCFSTELAESILKGRFGFMCQYDRKTGADTVWSVVYDVKHKKIYRAEGNPGRKRFREDARFGFINY